MGLRDKASTMLGALRRGAGGEAARALGDALEDARVRLMDEVVSRISGHPVHTATHAPMQPVITEAASPSAPGPVKAAPTEAASTAKAPASAAPAPAAPAPSAPAAPAAAPVAHASASSAPAPAPVVPAPAAAAPVVAPVVEPEPEPEPAERSGRRRRRRRSRSRRGGGAEEHAAEASAPAAAPAPELQADLPEGRLVLMARDPSWAFAHWEVPVERIQGLEVGLADPKALLRFYEKGSEEPIIDADVTVEAGSYYLRVPRPGRAYEARLVLVGASGEVREVARSNGSHAPAAAEGAPEPAAPRFVRMDAQREVLEQLGDLEVQPRLVMDVDAADAAAPARMPRDARWAAVMAELRTRKLASVAPLPTS